MKTYFLIFLSVLSFGLSAQDQVLETLFADAVVSELDINATLQSRNPDRSFELKMTIAGKERTLVLSERNMLADHYRLTTITENGLKHSTEHSKPLTTIGHVKGDLNSKVSLTLNEDFVYGRITLSEGEFFVEPVHHFSKNAKKGEYVIYDVTKIKDKTPQSCGVTHAQHKYRDMQSKVNNLENKHAMMGCLEVEWAIAHDWQMFQAFGSVSAVENHAVGVALDVQTNYDTEFADEIQFFITEHWVSNCNTCDPWTSSNDAGTLLSSFTNWGGFSFGHDIGSLWTDRDFNGSTIGIAWVGVVCGSNRYNCLQNFTSNPETKRVMVAHEIGHNFDATHDGSGSPFIMAPSVSTSTSWSNASVTDMQNFYNSIGCLGTCVGSGQPPAPSFTKDYIQQCTPGEVQFNDASSNSPNSWDWEFEGGTPSTSTQQNPTVFYANPGLFNVTLTVSNGAGSNSQTFINEVEIFETPFANYTYTTNGTTVNFDNISTGSNDFFWTFGDGNFSSDEHPVHNYSSDGVYTVTLQAVNGSCQDEYTQTVTVVSPPVASFTNSAATGCAPHTVVFDASQAFNAVSWEWNFEGGTPASSTEAMPSVVYNNQGQYDVQLIVTNSIGVTDTLTQMDFVDVADQPSATFTTAVNMFTVTFTNSSVNADSYLWDFGDGNTSTDPNPAHTYASGGTYTATLTATSICGSDISTVTLTLQTPPTASFTSDFQPNDILCAGAMVAFTAGQQSNIDNYEWNFQGGSPTTSTQAMPTVTYDNPGSYDVQLIVSNTLGNDTLTMSDFIIITDVPTADFTYSSSQLDVDFTNTSAGGDSFSWNFGDGSSSTMANPTHTYATGGQYTVMLDATNACGTETYVQTISVEAAPIASFTSDATVSCVGETVQYTSTSSANTTGYMWTFEGGTPASSTAANPTVTYNTIGQYDVTLEVSNSAGNDVVTSTDYIEIIGAPSAGLTYNVMGNTITITDQSTGASTIQYTLDGQVQPSNSFTVPSNGNYEIGVIATNACGETTASETVSVSAYPTSAFDARNTEGCTPVEVSFENTSTMATTYEWTFAGGMPASSTDAEPTVTYAASGTYEVTLVSTNAYGSQTSSQMISVTANDVPLPDYEYTSNAATISFVPDDMTATTYSWDFGDGNTSMEAMPSHTYSATGNYDVVLTITNECGSSTSMQTVMIEINMPVVQFQAQSTSGCVPFTVNFTDNTSNNPTSWSWSFPGGTPATSTEQNPSVVYELPGVYNVQLEATNEYGTSVLEQNDYIVVMDVPNADFVFAADELTVDFTGPVGSGYAYMWDFGDGNTSTDPNPRHTYTSGGRYVATLITTNDCGSTTSTQEFVITSVAVTNLDDIASIQVFPNPAYDWLTLRIKGLDMPSSTIHLMDMTGQIVKQQGVSINQNFETTLQVSDLPSGTYLLRVSGERGVYNKRLLILK